MSRSSNQQDAQYLWINNDGQSVAEKTTRVDKTLRAHVMNDYAQKKRSESIQRLKEDTSAVDQLMCRGTAGQGNQGRTNQKSVANPMDVSYLLR